MENLSIYSPQRENVSKHGIPSKRHPLVISLGK